MQQHHLTVHDITQDAYGLVGTLLLGFRTNAWCMAGIIIGVGIIVPQVGAADTCNGGRMEGSTPSEDCLG